MSTIEQIKEWVILHLEGRLDEQSAQLLQDWIRASPANAQAVEEFLDEARLRDGVRQLYHSRERIWQRLDEAIPDQPVQPVGRSYRMQWWWAAAAVFLLATGSYFFFKGAGGQRPAESLPQVAALSPAGGNKVLLTLSDGSVISLDSAGNGALQQGNTTVKMLKGQLQYIAGNTLGVAAWNKLSIPRGVQYRVNLPDGSSVWLNAASTLRYPLAFTGTERRVQLTGEAYFDIAPRADQPFIVDAGNTAVQVLGTTFNINAYPEEQHLKTTLVSGAISVKTAREEQVLQPGKMATVTAMGNCIITTVDVNAVTAWKDGYFRFDEDDLPAVMRQLERWYDITVKYEGNIPVRRFSGEIGRNTPLADVLEFLQKAKVSFRQEGNVITIVNH